MIYKRYRHVAIDDGLAPPTAGEIAAIEAVIGASLPAEFRDFLAVGNGGSLDYNVEVTDPSGNEILSFCTLFSTRPSATAQDDSYTFLGMLQRTREPFKLAKQVFPIAEDAGGSLLFLDLTPEGRGRDVAWVHGMPAWTGLREETRFVEVAPSFGAYVDKVFVSDDEAREMVRRASSEGTDSQRATVREFLDIALPDWRTRLGLDV